MSTNCENQSSRRQYRSQSTAEASNTTPHQPRAELSESVDWLRLTMDVPGVLAKDVEVDIQQDVLSVKGCRRTMSIDGTSCLKKNKFQRRFAINTQVNDVSKARAEFANGLLTIHAPKRLRPDSERNDIRLEVIDISDEVSSNRVEVDHIPVLAQLEASYRPGRSDSMERTTRTTIPLGADDSD